MCEEAKNIPEMLAGGFVGAVLGLGFSLGYQYCANRRKYRRLKRSVKGYFGVYSARLKTNEESHILSVELSYEKRNILHLSFETKNKGGATGFVILDENNLSFGKAYYYHTDKDKMDMSGTFELLFVRPGVIHANNNYIDSKHSESVNKQYIFEKTSSN